MNLALHGRLSVIRIDACVRPVSRPGGPIDFSRSASATGKPINLASAPKVAGEYQPWCYHELTHGSLHPATSSTELELRPVYAALEADAIPEKECYEGQFTNAWGAGPHYLLLDRASGILYFYGAAG